MLEEGWMGFEVVNLEREELFHPDLRKGMSGWNKRNEEDRNGFWQVVLTVCTVKEYSLLAFGQCSCGTCPAETPYWAEMFSGRNLFLCPNCLCSVDFMCSYPDCSQMSQRQG